MEPKTEPKENPGSRAATGAEKNKNDYAHHTTKHDTIQVFLTYWQDLSGHKKREVSTSWAAFVERLSNVKPCAQKKNSPLIKFARFGGAPTDAGSLRHDGNVIEVTGIEGDLDNGALSFNQARELLEKNNVKAVVCTTHSHTPDKPRLRVFAPLMHPCIPEARRRYVARLNGIVAGNLGEESFKLSQSYFIGGKPGAEYRVEHTFDDPGDGYFIDEDDNLDQLAIDPGERDCRASTREHSNKDNASRTKTFKGARGEDNKSERQQKTTFDNNNNISFAQGGRDNAIFHLANHLVKGGMPHDNILEYLEFIGKHCTPAFPKNEIHKKFQSALSRVKTRERSLTTEIREFIMTTSGNFLTTNVYEMTTVTTREDKKKVAAILSRMASAGDLIERTGTRHGEYRRIETECEEIDFLNASTDQVNFSLPFNLNQKARLHPGNIIVVAGEPNAGKTAMLLNMVRDNMRKFNLYYFSSEMGGAELRERLSNFKDTSLSDWKCSFRERSGNFGDVIVPGEGNVNIIDFMEIYENFYEISGKLAEIHRKLNGALAIIALQKNKGTDEGLGGERSLEKPRLYLNMGHGFLKIRKCKNMQKDPATGQSVEKPDGKRINFKLVDGCKFIAQGGWHYES